MIAGRTIRLFLVDGLPDSLLTAEIGNWTGLVTKAPRTQLAQLASRQGTGIYILIGDDPNDPDKQQVYIGEADSVATRLNYHSKDSNKDFWTDTIVVTSKDENLTKAHVRYLEGRLIDLTSQSGRATLINGTNPTIVGLPAPDKSDMDQFLAQLQILLPVLGIQFTTPAPRITTNTTTSGVPQATTNDGTLPLATSPFFELKTANAQGKAQEINSQFIVAQGALINPTETPSLGRAYKQLRTSFRSNGTLVDDAQTGKWLLTSDTIFSSPTAAAAVLCGYALNGRTAWKVENSTETYADWQDSLTQA